MLDELEKSLDDAFDPESKARVLAKFEGLLNGGTADMKKAVRDLVDPGHPGEPARSTEGTRLAAELKEVRQVVSSCSTQVAVEQTEAQVLELTAIKGRKFEETRVRGGRPASLAVTATKRVGRRRRRAEANKLRRRRSSR